VSRVSKINHRSPHVKNKADRAETELTGTRAYILVANFSNETLTLPQATVLGIAEPVGEDEIDKINPKAKSGVSQFRKRKDRLETKGHMINYSKASWIT
jgi:hypothetical protein